MDNNILRTPPRLPSTVLEPALFTLAESPILTNDSPSMARHSYVSDVRTPSHSRHRSVPAFQSPQVSDRTTQQPCSRGLAKLTLVERLSKESAPSTTSGDNDNASPTSMSPVLLEEGLLRPTHTPRRNRMSLVIPPTKSAALPDTAISRDTSPIRSTPRATSKHENQGNLTQSSHLRDRSMTNPAISLLEDLSTLDDPDAAFLTMIAFQERRVVELREELARAESELDLLKQQWTRQQLKLSGSVRQQHIRQNSLSKLEHQIMSGTVTSAPRADREDSIASSQILATGKRLAEGVKDGLFTIMDDLKNIAESESSQATLRRRGRSPTRSTREDTKSGVDPEKVEPYPWYPKKSSPVKRAPRRESDASVSTHATTSTDTGISRASSISSASSSIKSPTVDQKTPINSLTTTRPSDPSLWPWTMATQILNQSQTHVASLFTTVEKHLDSLVAGPEPPLHPRQTHRHPSGHTRTETVYF